MAHSARDYSREDYAPRDPTEVLYNLETRVFSYRPRSLIFYGGAKATLKSIPVPRLVREIRIAHPVESDDPDMADETGLVRLPKKVWIGRNLCGNYRELFLEG
ncbi:hypothetical protein BUE80_DR013417 [Diplocarpon rosae]|nr:hypothetical protein BUE80_DR013417 [Diplocarpon rosae]